MLGYSGLIIVFLVRGIILRHLRAIRRVHAGRILPVVQYPLRGDGGELPEGVRVIPTDPDLEPAHGEIRPGTPTDLWRYSQDEVPSARNSSVQPAPAMDDATFEGSQIGTAPANADWSPVAGTAPVVLNDVSGATFVNLRCWLE